MTVFSMHYREATKRSSSQTLACTQTCIFRVENVCNAYLHYEQTLSNAIHYTSNVNVLQESVNLLWLTETEHTSFAQFVYCTWTQTHITTFSICTD